MNVTEKLREIFREVFDDETLEISCATSPDDIDAWDSLAQITIVSRAQEAFDIEFEIAEIIGFSDVGSLVGIIEGKIKR